MTSTTSGSASADQVLQYDLLTGTTAAFYDLTEASERKRSVADTARFFFRLVKVLTPSVFIEAGAKDASSSRRARRHMEQGRIVAFEANPLNFAEFSQNADLAKQQVEYVHLALSDKTGSITFNVQVSGGQMTTGGVGSLLPRDGDDVVYSAVTVPCTRLDDFFHGKKLENACIWMDVEGATSQVLGGAPKVLADTGVIYVEVEDRSYWEGQWLADDVARFLWDAGFAAVARDYQGRYQYNVIFVKRSLLTNPRVRLVLSEHLSLVGSKKSLTEG